MSRYVRTRNRGKKIRIINDCKTTADWSSENPVLGDGHLGVDCTTGRIKCGNGVSPWSDLPFLRTGEMTTQTLQQTGSNLLLSLKERSQIETLKTKQIWEEIYISSDFSSIGYATLSGDWKILKKVSVTSGTTVSVISQQIARKTNNDSYSTIHDAWVNRDVLIYS